MKPTKARWLLCMEALSLAWDRGDYTRAGKHLERAYMLAFAAHPCKWSQEAIAEMAADRALLKKAGVEVKRPTEGTRHNPHTSPIPELVAWATSNEKPSARLREALNLPGTRPDDRNRQGWALRLIDALREANASAICERANERAIRAEGLLHLPVGVGHLRRGLRSRLLGGVGFHA